MIRSKGGDEDASEVSRLDEQQDVRPFAGVDRNLQSGMQVRTRTLGAYAEGRTDRTTNDRFTTLRDTSVLHGTMRSIKAFVLIKPGLT